jgi:hypothetical protein
LELTDVLTVALPKDGLVSRGVLTAARPRDDSALRDVLTAARPKGGWVPTERDVSTVECSVPKGD